MNKDLLVFLLITFGAIFALYISGIVLNEFCRNHPRRPLSKSINRPSEEIFQPKIPHAKIHHHPF